MGWFSRISSTDAKLVTAEIALRRRIYSEGYKAGWNGHSDRPPYKSILYRKIWTEGYQAAEKKRYG